MAALLATAITVEPASAHHGTSNPFAGHYLSPTSQDCDVGTSCSVDVRMHVNSGFASFGSGWRITFDPTILQVSSVTPGGAPYTTVVTNTFDNTAGTVDYIATGGTVVNADFVVATITFDVIDEGTSALLFTSPFVNQYIPGFGPLGINGTSVDGSITGVASGPPPNAAPDCSNAAPSAASLWPPNHKFNSVNVEGVTDPDGDAVTINIDGISQDEAVNGKGDGNTSPDGTGVGPDTAEVRAERSGKGDGRVYEIDYTADDGNGGTCSGTVEVGVPHDKKDTAVNSGATFDSTAS